MSALDLQADDVGETAERLWREAIDAFRARDYERAAGLMQTMLAEYGEGAGGIDAATVRQQLGVTLLRLKRTDEGVAELLRSTRLNPYDGRTRYKLGIGYSRLGQKDEALEQLRQSVKLSPQVADHHWRLSEELRRQGLELEAVEEVREALALDPNHADAQGTLKALKGARVRSVLRWVGRRLA
jgi:tetratricopeptide (TPR) repeat protein